MDAQVKRRNASIAKIKIIAIDRSIFDFSFFFSLLTIVLILLSISSWLSKLLSLWVGVRMLCSVVVLSWIGIGYSIEVSE